MSKSDHPNDDLREYLPDDEAADAAMRTSAQYNKDFSRPELLEQLEHMKTNPDLMRVPAVTAKRVDGEAEVPGVAKRHPERAVSGGARGRSVRTAVLAVLCVVLPVVLAIVVMERRMRLQEPERSGSLPGVTTALEAASTTVPVPSAIPGPAASVIPGPEIAPPPVAPPSAAAPAAPTPTFKAGGKKITPARPPSAAPTVPTAAPAAPEQVPQLPKIID